jgi:hypothetical protein
MEHTATLSIHGPNCVGPDSHKLNIEQSCEKDNWLISSEDEELIHKLRNIIHRNDVFIQERNVGTPIKFPEPKSWVISTAEACFVLMHIASSYASPVMPNLKIVITYLRGNKKQPRAINAFADLIGFASRHKHLQHQVQELQIATQ